MYLSIQKNIWCKLILKLDSNLRALNKILPMKKCKKKLCQPAKVLKFENKFALDLSESSEITTLSNY